MKECKETLDRVSQKKDQLAVYFCEESKNLKLEELFKQLQSFVTDLNGAKEVHFAIPIIMKVSDPIAHKTNHVG